MAFGVAEPQRNLATGSSLGSMMQQAQPQPQLATGQPLQQMYAQQASPQPGMATGQYTPSAPQGQPIAAQANPQQQMPAASPQAPAPNVPNIFGLRYMNPAMRRQTMQAATLRWGNPQAQARVRASQAQEAYVQQQLANRRRK